MKRHRPVCFAAARGRLAGVGRAKAGQALIGSIVGLCRCGL